MAIGLCALATMAWSAPFDGVPVPLDATWGTDLFADKAVGSPRMGLRLASAIGGSGADAVAMADGFAYVGMGPRLVVLDISDPAAPKRTAELRLASVPVALAVEGDLLAVVGQDGSVTLVAVDDPRRPLRLTELPLPRDAFDVALAGTKAYIAQLFSEQMAIWDVSDARQPGVIGTAADGCRPLALAVDGNRVVVAGKRENYTACLTIWDMADPARPRRLAGLNLPVDTDDEWVWDVALEGKLAYVGLQYGGLVIVNMDTGSVPAVVGRWSRATSAVRSAAAAGGLVYVADGYSAVSVLDVHAPERPTMVATHELYRATALALQGGLLAVTNGFAAVELLDVTAGPQPVPRGRYAADVTFVTDLATAKTTSSTSWSVFVLTAHAVHAYDLSTPSGPRRLGSHNVPCCGDALAADRGRVYVGTRYDGVVILDAADPANLREIGRFVPDDTSQLPLQDNLRVLGVDAAGDLAVVAMPDRLYFVDVSDPRAPELLRSENGLFVHGLFLPGVDEAAIEIVEPWVYVADIDGVHAFHATDGRRHGHIDRGALGLDILGNRAFAAYGSLSTLDVSDPTQMSVLGTTTEYRGTHQDVRVRENSAVVASGDEGLMLYDVTSSVPQPLFALDTPGFARHVGLAEDAVVVADHDGGMSVFETVALPWRVTLPLVERGGDVGP